MRAIDSGVRPCTVAPTHPNFMIVYVIAVRSDASTGAARCRSERTRGFGGPAENSLRPVRVTPSVIATAD
jgi:hypothetical protein